MTTKSHWLIRLTLLSACAAIPMSAMALDKVKLRDGNPLNGRVTEISPSELTFEQGSSSKKKTKLAVNELEFLQFDNEPSELTKAREAVQAGHYDEALALLNKLDEADLPKRVDVGKDVEFYKALCAARLALAGAGSKSDAGKKLLEFEKNNANSHHYFAACEVLGDLLVALNKPEQAESFYAKLAEAPWADYKMRAANLQGRALLVRKSFDQALSKFDEAMTSEATGKDADTQRLAAQLGKAAAMSGQGKHAEAIKLIEEVIAKADPAEVELHARAYTVLGNCYEAEGKKKDALLAYLHVDLLWPRCAEQHAESLAHLATLWEEVNKPERAAQARALLKEKYPNSSWTEK